MKKNVLIVSTCSMRGGSIGVIGELLKELSCLDKEYYSFSLLDTNDDSKESHQRENYKVDYYFNLPRALFDGIVGYIPGFRSYHYKNKVIKTFKKIITEKQYGTILLFPVVSFSEVLIKLAHDKKSKVIFYPWGSEILRCDSNKRKKLLRAFSIVDYVVGAMNANTVKAAKEVYHVPDDRIKEKKPFVSGIAMLESIKGLYSRKQLSDFLNVAESSCNIVCSYNGYASHKHDIIIDAVALNKEVLPKGYQLIFPLTYGAAPGYVESLKSKCKDAGLRATFITKFLTAEQMACLHYLTDLFIEIQPTDTGNGFLIEALYSKNEIITGRWLHYEQFEKYGEPYHLIDTLDELPHKIHEVILRTTPKPKIPEQIIQMYSVPTDTDRCLFWGNLFK